MFVQLASKMALGWNKHDIHCVTVALSPVVKWPNRVSDSCDTASALVNDE